MLLDWSEKRKGIPALAIYCKETQSFSNVGKSKYYKHASTQEPLDTGSNTIFQPGKDVLGIVPAPNVQV